MLSHYIRIRLKINKKNTSAKHQSIWKRNKILLDPVTRQIKVILIESENMILKINSLPLEQVHKTLKEDSTGDDLRPQLGT